MYLVLKVSKAIAVVYLLFGYLELTRRGMPKTGLRVILSKIYQFLPEQTKKPE
jgi:hypothetical protein